MKSLLKIVATFVVTATGAIIIERIFGAEGLQTALIVMAALGVAYVDGAMKDKFSDQEMEIGRLRDEVEELKAYCARLATALEYDRRTRT